MKNYDIEEIKSTVEGMSLREKIEYLRDVQWDIMNEIEELESVEIEVEELLSDAETQVNEKYDSEIGVVLNDVKAAHPGDACTLITNTTLDIEGLRFCFMYWPGDGFNQLSIAISGRKHIIQTGDFNAEFGDIVKQLFPEAKYRNMSFEFNLATEADTVPVVLVKDIAEKLVSIAPKIADLAEKYRFV